MIKTKLIIFISFAQISFMIPSLLQSQESQQDKEAKSLCIKSRVRFDNSSIEKIIMHPEEVLAHPDERNALLTKMNTLFKESSTMESEELKAALWQVGSSDRAYYVVGCFMAKTIDDKLGRDQLALTISEGSRFF